jgi:hypothetical protein
MKRLAGIVAVAAVAVGLTVPTVAVGDPPLPEGCVKERGTIVCETQPGGSGDAASGQTSSTKTETKKGSFSSSHPTCKTPPPQGKCE